MQMISTFINNLWSFLNDFSVYLLFGLLFAGVMKQFIPENFVKKQLGKRDISSILKSAIFGIPLPLCSCSVLPFATALKKDGASKSSVQTFLIATPITGIDSILATWGTLGGVFTIYRVISSFIISIIAGFLTIFLKDEKAKTAFQGGFNFTANRPDDFSILVKKSPIKAPFYKRVYTYAFDTLLKDIVKPLLIGMVVAALISTLFADALPSFLGESRFLSYILMLAISIPLYVCATASIPIGISFILAGFSPGAAFIFLTAGPASNMVTILVVKKLLGVKALFVYITSIVLGSLFFAYFMDFYFQDEIIGFTKHIHQNEQISQLSILSTIILLALCFKILTKKNKSCCD